ncbi:MAG TPA: glucose-6-phosphate dehydrogenase [Chitinophagaceae bacterium]|nr:glucose-6-phosphate dehydrogenase [Chitinophagaceae bacterium]
MKEKKLHPASIVIFGAKGDLTRRKLIPALFNLFLGNHLPDMFNILCVDYLPVTPEAFSDDLREGVDSFSRNGKADPAVWAAFSKRLQYLQGDFTNPETYLQLKTQLASFENLHPRQGTRVFYYAVAPRFIETISEGLYKEKICTNRQLHRIVIEKPFGTDLVTAQSLNRFLQKRFAEKQLYRIDHYLGKETVQNILAFRFANHVFEPLWNNQFIDHVQISVAESVTVGSRGGYYDAAGAIRDMIQNHLLQLLCVIAMECPVKYEPEIIRNVKAKVLKDIKIYRPEDVFKDVVRGQYTDGQLNGQPQNAYRAEEHVSASSVTETYVAARMFINNKRWKGVPFFLRTGKALQRQASVIVIQFKDSPYKIFKDDTVPNRLIISIQPEQEISLLFESKIPGLQMKLTPVEMDFMYKDAYTQEIPEAYETLLLDVLEGDATLFMRADQVEAAWKVVMPVINAWKRYPAKQLRFYEPGSWGPVAADKLLKPFAKDWILLPGEAVAVGKPVSV